MLYLGLFAAALVLGIILVCLGRRGRRLDFHPVCRRCGFDLHGHEDRPPTCPECGADLAGARAVRRGNRETWPWVTVLGVALTAGAVLLAGATGWAVFYGSGYDAYKPAWLLTLEIRARSEPTVHDAVDELANRLAKKSLSSRQARAAADAVLDIQGDPAAHWSADYGDFIEDALTQGLLTDARGARYGKQGIELTWQARPRLHAREALPVRAEVGDLRLGTRQLNVNNELKAATIDGQSVPTPSIWASNMWISPQQSWGSNSTRWVFTSAPRPDGSPMATGSHRVGLTVRWTVTRAGNHGHQSPNSQELFAFTTTAEPPAFEVVPPSEVTLAEVTDRPDVARLVHQKLEAVNVKVKTQNGGPWVELDYGYGSGQPAVQVMYDVTFEDADTGQRWHFGNYAAGPNNTSYTSGTEMDGFDAKRINVHFDPEPDRARQTVDVFEIWSEPFVVSDVPVKWAAGARSTASTQSGSAKQQGSKPQEQDSGTFRRLLDAMF